MQIESHQINGLLFFLFDGQYTVVVFNHCYKAFLDKK